MFANLPEIGNLGVGVGQRNTMGRENVKEETKLVQRNFVIK